MPKKKSRKVSLDKFLLPHVKEDVNQGTDNLEIVRPISAVVNFPALGAKGGGGYNFDFEPFYGQRFDDLVNRAYYTTKALLDSAISSGSSQNTILSYLTHGFKYLADYLPLYRQHKEHDLSQADISPELMDNLHIYLKTLKKKDGDDNLSYLTQKNCYSKVKAFFHAMKARGYWDASPEYVRSCFKSNPYPKSNQRSGGGASPFTPHEKKQLVIALKQAIMPIIKKDREEPLSAYELAVSVLAIAMQTGINTRPLLEMSVNSLSDHPLKFNRRLLTVFKRRGNATQLHNLRNSEEVYIIQGVKLDVALLIETITKLNVSAREALNTDLLLTYTSNHNRTAGMATSLTENALYYYTASLIREYNLKDEDGNPITVNASRIRKTFINGMYELSGEDLVVAASIAAKHQDPSTTDLYLRAPEEAKKNLGRAAEIRVVNILNESEEKTPMGTCKDTKFGDRAPKNGKICTDFLGCFRCKSFVITLDDLWKLYSFYWAIIRNRESFGRKNWKKYLKDILRVIDEHIEPRFIALNALPQVQAMKEKARTTPHPYWKNLDMLRVGK
ncbi:MULTISPECIES: hypothetical protein [Vibrio harveyi group]|uniref:hypothetical protein n=1 Tax=Vibrio harveyi group TaxID=717610 RepID=UPI0021534972|nr:hypothetical protein [Vibrio parahaemolyticus]MCR9965454.1 hypothetical protein [Vibrio antiquarius]